MSVLAALAASLAMLTWRPPGRWWVRHRLGLVSASYGRAARVLLVGTLVAVGGPLVLALPGPRIVLSLTVLMVGLFGLRQMAVGRRRQRISGLRASATEMLGLMAAELRAGALPSRVLTGLAHDFAFLSPAARATALGGDVPAALRASSETPGLEVLADVGGAWQVAERAGAPLVQVLARLEHTARTQREIEQEVASGIAPARATGRLMAVLPMVGLLLGSGMGGDPVGVLTGTWIGVACLAGGCGLACAGVAWVERIASSIEREP